MLFESLFVVTLVAFGVAFAVFQLFAWALSPLGVS